MKRKLLITMIVDKKRMTSGKTKVQSLAWTSLTFQGGKMPEVSQEKDQVSVRTTTFLKHLSKKARTFCNRNPLAKWPSVSEKVLKNKEVCLLDHNDSISSSDGIQNRIGEDQLGRGPRDQAHVRIQGRPSGLHSQPEP